MGGDVLSQVLQSVHLTGAVFFDVDAVAPWVAETPSVRAVAEAILPGRHVLEYHAVLEGECWAGVVGEEPTHLKRGDIVVFPQGDPHVLSSAPGMRGDPSRGEIAGPVQQVPMTLAVGRDRGDRATETALICGFLSCDARPFNPLLAALPRQIVVRADDGERGNWLELFLRVALAETRQMRSGSQCVLARMSELMFIETVRRYIDRARGRSNNWLAALADPQLSRAMERIHDDPGAPHTLDSLARSAGMSRSGFVARFTEIVGQAPIQYLTRWRMQVATDLLGGPHGLAEIAGRVGYDSEAAFHRAFKRWVGVSPGAWRRGRSGAGDDDLEVLAGHDERAPA